MKKTGLTADKAIEAALRLGASTAAAADISMLEFHGELLALCEMNSCGKYSSCWGCAPGCGEAEQLFSQISSLKQGVVFQYVGRLTDSFDIEGMEAAWLIFSRLATALKLELSPLGALVFGAGGCHICENCTYPDAPCRFPEKCTPAVEACGVNVSELCSLAGLSYINGSNTVTYSGLITIPPAAAK